MQNGFSSRPALLVPRRELIGFSIAADEAGNRLPVVAFLPGHVDDASGLAALIEAAAVVAGLEFADFMKLIDAAAPCPCVFEVRPPSPAAHRPSYDWVGNYGRSVNWLTFMVSFHRMMRPGLTAASARRAVLVRARAKMRAQTGKRVFSDATIAKDADRLKQAYR